MEAYYTKSIKCPICEASYSTLKIHSRAMKVIHVDPDFCAHYEGNNPSFYAVNVCSCCGFSYLDKTESITKITNNQKSHFQQVYASRWNPRNYGDLRTSQMAIETYKLAIISANGIDAGSKYLGGLCLSLAWLYRHLQDKSNETKFLSLSFDFYQHLFQTDSTYSDEGKLPFLLGELARQLGQNQAAVSFFNTLIQDPKTHIKYKKMAREQWSLLRTQTS